MSSNATMLATTSAMRNAAPRMSATRNGVLRSSLFMHGIAGVANGVDQRRIEGSIDLRAQAADVRFNHAGLRIKMKIPDALEQHCAGDDAALVAHQIFEQ